MTQALAVHDDHADASHQHDRGLVFDLRHLDRGACSSCSGSAA